MTLVRRSARDPVFGRVVANSGWLVGANALILVTSFIQGVILARSLGPADFGVLSVVLALTVVVQQLLSSRVWEAAIKFVVEFRARGDAERAGAVAKLCLLADVAAGAIAGLALLWIADWAAGVFAKSPEAASAIRLYAFSSILAIPVATCSALLRIADRYRWLAFQLAAESAVRLVGIVVVLGTAGASIRSVLWAYLLAGLVSAAVLVVLGRRAWRELGLSPWRESTLSALRGDLPRILRFMLYTNLSGTSRLLTANADVLVLGWFANPQSVGLYRLARTVSDPLAVLFNSVYQAVYPEMSRLVHEANAAEVRRLAKRLRALTTAIVLPVCIAVFATAGWLLPLVFGDSYSGAVTLTRIMVWQLVWVPYLWLPGLLLALGRARLVALVNIVDAADYLVLLLVLVPPFGATGAAVATLLRFVVWTAMAATLERRIELDLERTWV